MPQRKQQHQLFLPFLSTTKLCHIGNLCYILSSLRTLCFADVFKKSIPWHTDAFTPTHSLLRARSHSRAHSFSRAENQCSLWCASCPLKRQFLFPPRFSCSLSTERRISLLVFRYEIQMRFNFMWTGLICLMLLPVFPSEGTGEIFLHSCSQV